MIDYCFHVEYNSIYSESLCEVIEYDTYEEIFYTEMAEFFFSMTGRYIEKHSLGEYGFIKEEPYRYDGKRKFHIVINFVQSFDDQKWFDNQQYMCDVLDLHHKIMDYTHTKDDDYTTTDGIVKYYRLYNWS